MLLVFEALSFYKPTMSPQSKQMWHLHAGLNDLPQPDGPMVGAIANEDPAHPTVSWLWNQLTPEHPPMQDIFSGVFSARSHVAHSTICRSAGG